MSSFGVANIAIANARKVKSKKCFFFIFIILYLSKSVMTRWKLELWEDNNKNHTDPEVMIKPDSNKNKAQHVGKYMKNYTMQLQERDLRLWYIYLWEKVVHVILLNLYNRWAFNSPTLFLKYFMIARFIRIDLLHVILHGEVFRVLANMPSLIFIGIWLEHDFRIGVVLVIILTNLQWIITSFSCITKRIQKWKIKENFYLPSATVL